MEFLENVGYTVLGGGLAAIFGLVAQRVHTERESRRDIKKIQDLLKLEFEELYQILMEEKRNIKKAKCRVEQDLDLLSKDEIDIPDYFDRVGGLHLESLVWDAVISSGNLIKLDNGEIEIIQLVQQGVRHYNKNMDQLRKDAGKKLEKNLNKCMVPNILNLPDEGVLEGYLDECKRIIDETVKRFEELNTLPWFDYTKTLR